jgi:branched-chain amino acid transport system permease protein
MNTRDFDWKPLALVPALALLVLPFIGSPSTWLTLTVAGLAMGMIIFIIASGLTLVFGLMDVLNFGHGVFIALGAFVATSVLGAMGDWTGSAELWRNLVAVLPAMLVAMAVAGAVGLAFERFIVRPVYGQHLKQILITMGGMIIGEELIKVIWGPQQIALPLPEGMRGSLLLGDAAIEKYRLVPVCRGPAGVWRAGLDAVAHQGRPADPRRRAGPRDGRKRWATASAACLWACLWWAALAGLGGVMWGLYQQKRGAADGRAGQRADLHRHHHRRAGQHGRRADRRAAGGPDGQLHRLLAPKVALFSNIALMVAMLLWRPQGVYPVKPTASRLRRRLARRPLASCTPVAGAVIREQHK